MRRSDPDALAFVLFLFPVVLTIAYFIASGLFGPSS